MSKRKKVLVCVTGMTPQIVTETLYVLMVERAEWIDEIRVMTTLDGRNQLLSTLLDPEGGQFFAFCREFGFDSSRIKFDETTIWLLRSSDSMLRDIRTESDNVQAGNQICELVRTLTSDPETTLYASVAGGRKTMGIFLTTALQLFGRVQDRLSHVLVSEDFETHPDFFYIPPHPRELEIKDRFGTVVKRVSTTEARIFLADIPFIRLRGLLTNWQPEIVKYSELVARAQEDLDLAESAYAIHIRRGTGRRGWTVSIANRSARLTEREVFVYVLLIEACYRGLGPIAIEDMTQSLIDAALDRLFTARGLRYFPTEPLPTRLDFVNRLRGELRSWQAGESYQLSLKESFIQTISKTHRKFEEAGLPPACFIATRGERGALRYELKLAPERIVFD